ncbi:Tryptophan--tRNA ligase, mitochondrial [Tilletia horrida]|nr:Tryptophan--tRNA ligase, mitochondrial [Tilletia horrida]
MEASFFLLAAGSNAQGQLAIGHVEDAHEWTPTLCRWHDEREGESSKLVSFPPTGTKVITLVGGANHSIAIVEDQQTAARTLWGAGDARRGQLGPHLQQSFESVPTFAGLKPECWFSSLPKPSAPSTSSSLSTGPHAQQVIAVAAAWESSYIALPSSSAAEDDTLLSLGNDNDFGQLGIGATLATDELVHRVDLRAAIRTFQQESGEGTAKEDGRDRLNVISLSAGVRHVCAVVRLKRTRGGAEAERDGIQDPLSQNTTSDRPRTFLIGWGAARHGQLAHRSTRNQAQRGTSKNAQRAVWLPRVIDAWAGAVDVQVSCGRDHTVYLVKHGNSKCGSPPSAELFTFGSNRQGQCLSMPLSIPLSDTTQIAAMWNTTLVLSNQRTIRAWGAASRGQAGTSVSTATVEDTDAHTDEMFQHDAGARITFLISGSEHAIVKVEGQAAGSERGDSNNSFWAWGWTEHGNIPGQLVEDENDATDRSEVFEQPVRIWPGGRKARERTARRMMSSGSKAAKEPAAPRPKVIFSGIQPTGVPHLGNYLGALCSWVDLQASADPADALYFSVVGYHSISMPQNPKRLLGERRDMLAALLAIGLDPERCTIFQQDQSKLSIARGDGSEAEADTSNLLLGLFAYPVLQAADIMLYKSTHVPVGDDQTQHLELTRDIVDSFNSRYKRRVFPLPQVMSTPAKRILSLRDPTSKMSKSAPDPASRIVLTDTPDQIAAKLKRAVTDGEPRLSYDSENRPAVSNLLLILATLRQRQAQAGKGISAGAITPASVAEELNRGTGGGAALKVAVTEAVIEALKPVQRELVRLLDDKPYVLEVERKGRDKARERAAQTILEVKRVIGLEE